MIALAASEVGIPILPDGLNSNPWLLNTKNGTIDLKSGQLRSHNRNDLISSLVPVSFDQDAALSALGKNVAADL